MTASTILRACRHASGISQGNLALDTGTSQPDVSLIERGKRIPTVETFERLLRRTGHQLVAVPGTAPGSVETGARISRTLQESHSRDALRHFLNYSDGLAGAHGINRVLLAAAEPAPTGSKPWDAALAGLSEFWLNKENLPKPDWITDSDRYLANPATPHLTNYDLAPDLAKVPTEFLGRNVLLERGTLASV